VILFSACVTLLLLCLFDPLSVENRIWGDGFGTAFGGFRQFGACPVDSGKPVVDIIPKSKDRFMERSPMKRVQP
jgi:hypothetical protein